MINSLPFYMVVQPGHVKTGYVETEMFVHWNLEWIPPGAAEIWFVERERACIGCKLRIS